MTATKNTFSATTDGDLLLALRIADAMDDITLCRFGASDLRIDTKPDLTPVSDADRAAEECARRLLAEYRPGDSVFGEEQGGADGCPQRRWIIDPIDGTKNYVRSVPVWASLIALEVKGEIVLGVVSAPALHRRWWAAKGTGAYVRIGKNEPRHIHVSKVNALQDASLSYSSLTGWEDRSTLAAFIDLTRSCWRTRAYGDFWSYMMVAEGSVDIATEPDLELYDMAALVPIIEEAGGVFTSLDGECGPYGGNAIASNGLLHDAALGILTTH